MKKSLFLITFLFCSASLFSQTQRLYKPFRVHISPLMYAIPTNTSAFSSGFGFSVEPAYAIDDNNIIGLRIESAGMGVGKDLNDKVGVVASYAVTYDEYLNQGDTRFFLGAVLGYARTATATISSNNTEYGGNGYLGGGRIGVQLNHFRVSAEYNGAPKGMSYFSLKAALTLGGGKL